MSPDLLHVIAVRVNPLRWQTPDMIYRAWVEHMLASGVALTVIECQFGERPFVHQDPRVNHIGVRARTQVWSKENLINLAIARLPADWRYVAWIDSDVFFRRVDWATETVQALQLHHVVQPWADCLDLGPQDQVMAVHKSFCRIYRERQPIMQGPNAGDSRYTFAHPGFAYAATRQAIEWMGGLIDTAVLGAADHHMAMALIGRVADSIHGGMTDDYKRPLYQWQHRAAQHIGGHISYLPMTIEHRWHGKKALRNYVSRWEVLVKNRFDPYQDLKRNTFGVIELAGNKPQLQRDIELYFLERSEDDNCL